MSYLDTKLQYFPNNIKEVKPVGELTLYQWLYSIKHPKESVMQLFKDIEEASAVGDLKRKAELKASLHYLTPATVSDGKGRSYTNVVGFTGLASVDVDGLTVQEAVEFKEYLFNTYPFFIATYLSPSRSGVKGLVKIPVCQSVEEYKSYYYGLLAELEVYKGVDPAPKNCVLAHYITYDKKLLYRLDATEFNQRGIQIDEFKIQTEECEDVEIDLADVPKIKKLLKRMVEQVDIDHTAHLKIRSVGLLSGGYVGAGYFSAEEIKDYLFDLMEQTVYLHKGMRGYKLTLTQMINRGQLAPIAYEDER